MRTDGREVNQLRDVEITRNYTKYAEGSVLVEIGDTMVLCNVSIENSVPYFLRGQNKGWLTAEYSLLPRATQDRNIREAAKRKLSGRTQEIQRLIGRSLRAIIDLDKMGERTIWVDCDVLQADGGTRTASITGAYVALVDAINFMMDEGKIKENPLKGFMAATSVGIVKGTPMLDLCYEEDFNAQVDMNIAMTEAGEIIEIQGTAEEHPFSRDELDQLYDLAEKGILELIEEQKLALVGK